MFLIDTDHFTILQRQTQPEFGRLWPRVARQPAAEFFVAVPFDDAAARQFDALRAGRVRVATMDLRIAAIALARDPTVLTRNGVDFGKVPGVRYEDWTV